MRVIARRALREFWESHRDAEQALKSWFHETCAADWNSSHEVKAVYRSASVLGDGRVVFNIAGNKYRLVVKFNYPHRIAYIRFVGTHADYDRIDAEKI